MSSFHDLSKHGYTQNHSDAHNIFITKDQYRGYKFSFIGIGKVD